MLKFTLCCLLSLISTISFAQKSSKYTPEYFEKIKCKDCILIIDTINGKFSQVATRNITRKSRSWHGCGVSYYDNGIPEEVVRYYYSVLHGKYITFYENGFLKEKGLYRKALPHGRWTYYDSTGKIERIVHYKNGNEVSNEIKYQHYFTYGMPNFWAAGFEECRDSIHRKWQIIYYPIAGCVVSRYAQKLANKHNRRVNTKMISLYGKDWKNRIAAEIKTHCSR